MPKSVLLPNPGSLPMVSVRNCLLILAGIAAFPVWSAAFTDDFARQLPDPAARHGQSVISRQEALDLLKTIQPPPEDRYRCESLLKQKIMERRYQFLLREFLKKEGFDPAALPTGTFLSRAAGLPENAPELKKAAADPENALRLAWQCYLAEKQPDLLKITPEEVETFYRNHPELFRRPARIQQQHFLCPDAKTAEIVRFRIQQGQSAQKVASDLPGVRLTETQTNGSAIREWQQKPAANGAVLLIRSTKEPETALTLQEASDRIRSTLLTRHSARAMSLVLKKLLAQEPVQFFF